MTPENTFAKCCTAAAENNTLRAVNEESKATGQKTKQ